MTTTLASLGIDPTSHGYISADLLTSGRLTALYEYAKSLEERLHHEFEAFSNTCSTCRGAGELVEPNGNPATCWDCNGSGFSVPKNLSQQNIP